MDFTFEKLDSIVLEEADVSAIENKYQTRYMLNIEPNGLVYKTNFVGKISYVYYKANIEDIKYLHDQLLLFIDNISGAELYSEDCAKDVYLNYGLISLKVPGASYDANKISLSDLINNFVESKCVEISEEEAQKIA